MYNHDLEAEKLKEKWHAGERWQDTRRDYSAEDVVKLRTSLKIEYTLAQYGAERLWTSLHKEKMVTALGALSGSQAVQMVKAGLKSIYMSGWQVAADANSAGQTYPDQSLYPSNSVPNLVKRLNNALMRADQIKDREHIQPFNWYVPIVADAEAGFGGPLHAFELMKAMIEAGAAGVHFEDQLAAEKKCGHLGGKVLVPTSQFIKTLIAGRLAADVLDVPTIIIARTDALNASLLTSDIDPRDRLFIQESRTEEGYFHIKAGLASAIARGLAYAPYADLLWFETATPNLEEAEAFAKAIHAAYPNKIFAYNCSPSFNWKDHLNDQAIASFNNKLAQLGYKYQFVTLAGWHALNLASFKLAHEYTQLGMPAYVKLQEEEFSLKNQGYTAVKHQTEVGTAYFDQILMTVTGGSASTAALSGSTEVSQFITEQAIEDKGKKSKHVLNNNLNKSKNI